MMMKRICIVALFVAVELVAAKRLEEISIDKASVASQTDEQSQLELVKVIFCFNDAPVMQISHASHLQGHTFDHETYYFTSVQVNKACEDKLMQLNQQRDKHYRIACKQTDQGVQVDIYYDPHYIQCCCDQLDDMNADHKNIVVRLVNKALLNDLASYDKPLIQVAHFAYTQHIPVTYAYSS